MRVSSWSAVISVASPRGNDVRSSLCIVASLTTGSYEVILVTLSSLRESIIFSVYVPILQNRCHHMLYLVDVYEATR